MTFLFQTMLMSNAEQKKVILVAGMHRSGTSALARVISLLGAKMSDRLIPPDSNNVTGFWESVELTMTHNDLLASAGSSWDDVSAFPKDWYLSDAASIFKLKIVEILRESFQDSALLVVKDPRICRIVPFWLSVLRDFNATPIFVIPVRNPLEVAASLKARDGLSLERSLLLWLRHIVDAEAETRQFSRSILFYDDLLENWQGCMRRVAEDIDVEWPVPPADAVADISDFLSIEHRHHRVAIDEVIRRPDIVGWVRAALSALRGDRALISGRMDVIRQQLDQADEAYRPLLSELRHKNEEQASALSALKVLEVGTTRSGADLAENASVILGLQNDVARSKKKTTEQESLIVELQQQLMEQKSESANLEMIVAEKERAIADLQHEMTTHAAMAAEARRLGSERENEINRLNVYLAEKTRHLDALLASTSWRITAPLRALVTFVLQRPQQVVAENGDVKSTQSSGQVIRFLRIIRTGVAALPRLLLSGSFRRKSSGSIPGMIRCELEQGPADRIYVGKGLEIFVKGWIFGAHRIVRRVNLRIGNKHYDLRRIREPRPDIADRFPFDTEAMLSGFSDFVSLPADITGTVEVEAVAYFDDDSCQVIDQKQVIFLREEEFYLPIAEVAAVRQAPLVAICMAAYEPHLEMFRAQIESIRRQTYDNWVCIISDDHSSAEALSSIRDILGEDQRFKLLANHDRRGHYWNFERALRHVPRRATYVALADQDDVWYEDKVASLVQKLEESPKVTLAYSDMRVVRDTGEVLSETYWNGRKNYFKHLGLLLTVNTVCGAACVFRRELLDIALPFPQLLGYGSHDHFIVCAATASGKIAYIDKPLYDYVQHASNVYGHTVYDAGKDASFYKVIRTQVLAATFGRFLSWNLDIYYSEFVRASLYARNLKLRIGSGNRHIAAFNDRIGGFFRLILLHWRILLFKETTYGHEVSMAVSYLAKRAAVPYFNARAHILRARRSPPLAANANATAVATETRPITADAYLQHLTSTGHPSSDYLPISSEHVDGAASKVKLVAFYLPQFHPIPENDEWWGKGFTEWTNVTKAVPQFEGHYQPRLPGELGFYDLRVDEVHKRQIELAKQYGIHGFCYHHYWFNGKRLLERPVSRVLSNPEFDMPFCLSWANENWTRRWDGSEDQILMAQSHSPEDDIAFIKDIEPALRDPRYIRIGGRCLLMVYRPSLLPDPAVTAERWRNYCIRAGIGDLYLVAAQTFGFTDPRPIGYDAAVQFPPHNNTSPAVNERVKIFNPNYTGGVIDYRDFAKRQMSIDCPPYKLFRTVIPSWDNEARRPGRGYAFHFSSPSVYGQWLANACEQTCDQLPPEERLVFINAWNEWAEGAHLEPDRRYGYAYLQATADVVSRMVEVEHEDEKNGQAD